MDNMFNEKVKVEKSEKGKKTKGKGKAKIRVEQNDMVILIVFWCLFCCVVFLYFIIFSFLGIR